MPGLPIEYDVKDVVRFFEAGIVLTQQIVILRSDVSLTHAVVIICSDELSMHAFRALFANQPFSTGCAETCTMLTVAGMVRVGANVGAGTVMTELGVARVLPPCHVCLATIDLKEVRKQ